MNSDTKSKVFSTIKLIIILFISITLLNTIFLKNTYALSDDPSAANRWAESIVDSMGIGNKGAMHEIRNGVSYAKTGYLCYMLTADGHKAPGTRAVAFKSPLYNQAEGSIWICSSRKGDYSVSGWSGTAPWNLTPWEEGGAVTNEPRIKDWFLKKVDGVQNASTFIVGVWGTEAAEKYDMGEYILVIETIMHFQYSVKNNSQSMENAMLALDLQIQLLQNCQDGYLMSKARSYGYERSYAEYSRLLDLMWDAYNAGDREKGEEYEYRKKCLVIGVRSAVVNELKAVYEERLNNMGASRQLMGQPIIGTVPNAIDYAKHINCPTDTFDSYLRNTALFAERIEPDGPGVKAGFVYYDGQTNGNVRLSDGEIKRYGLAMMVLAVTQDAVNTYSIAEGSPGKAEDPADNPNKQGICIIVKGYYTENEETGEKTSDGVFVREEVTNIINISEEPEYELVEWDISTTKTTPNPISWNPPSPTRGGTDPEQVELKTPEKVVYVLLKKTIREEVEVEEDTYVLSESRLSRAVDTENPDKGEDLLKPAFKITLPALKKNHEWDCGSCHGHSGRDTDGDGQDDYWPNCGHCHGGHAPHDMPLVADKKEVFIVAKNNSRDGSLISDLDEDPVWGDKWEAADGIGTKFVRTTRDTIADKHLKNYVYNFIIHRSQKDKAQLYEGVVKHPIAGAKQGVEGLFQLKFTASLQGTNSRKNGKIAYPLTLPFVLDEGKSILDTMTKCSSGCNVSDTKRTTMTPYTPSGVTVRIETYAGDPAGGIMDASYNSASVMHIPLSGYNNVTGRMISQGKSFYFYPYVMMQYDNINEQKQTTYVTGQYKRGMSVNDYAEIAWNTTGNSNLHLTSNQWSTHAGAVTLINKLGASMNSMLPGGALHSLDTKNSNQEIAVITYQTILEGEGLTQVEYSGSVPDKLKEAHAVSLHTSFVQSVASTLDAIQLQQWIDSDETKDTAFGGFIVSPGSDISRLGNGSSKASTDTKYYFTTDTGSGSSDNDLDINVGSPNTVKYTFSSDVAGNIYMNGSKILSQGQDASAISGRAKMIDQRTGVVTKLVKAIERNTGADENSWAPSSAWYNEAFNGVTVIVQTTKIQVGLHDPSVRSTILDPKLIPKQESKGTLFQDAQISQFKTNPQTIMGNNILGTFAGKQIATKNLDILFWSNPFYIPDANVQDLS